MPRELLLFSSNSNLDIRLGMGSQNVSSMSENDHLNSQLVDLNY